MFDEMDARVEAADFLESTKSDLEEAVASKIVFMSELTELKEKLEVLKTEVFKRESYAWTFKQKEDSVRALAQTCVDRPYSYWFDILNKWMQFRKIQRKGGVLYIEPSFCPCCLPDPIWTDVEYSTAWVIFLKSVQGLGIRRVVGVMSCDILEKVRASYPSSGFRFVTTNGLENLEQVMSCDNAKRIGQKTGVIGDRSPMLVPVIPGLLVWRYKKDFPLSELRSRIKIYVDKN